MKKILSIIIWGMVALLGAWGYAVLAFRRGEQINSIYLLLAALCTYAIGYRFYSKWIAAKVLALNDLRATPCEVHDDGRDFVKTNKWIVFGHHFAAISGPGPLVGPVLAAQFGYLPSAIWILIGVVLGGAVQDFVILFSSIRRDGKSLGQMVREELNGTAGAIATLAILAIMVILLAVLGLVVVKALAESPWGVFTVAATIPIAMLMGAYLRYGRVGKVIEATIIGVVLLLLAVWGGKLVHQNEALSGIFGLKAEPLAWSIIIYGLAASILPVWLLLAPRDYLSTFMKLGTIFALALGIFLVLPVMKMPALTSFGETGAGLVVAGKLFPFCFITIACGAISGFHTLISSGTTPKIITRESYARPIGYGAMCLESLVAIMALIAACTLEPGVYFSINVKGDPAATVAKVTEIGYPVTVEEMDGLAKTIGESTLFGRTGGASTLAVGMAVIFSKTTQGRWLDLWYHFAIMFEALFILTTIDAGTRVGRYLLQDSLGHIWKPLGNFTSLGANIFSSVLLVAAWGWFLVQGVLDPLGGINSLWPLFGIANQLLAAIALCLATTIILKMQLAPSKADEKLKVKLRRTPLYMLVTLVPLAWLLTVTMTAGVQKIFHEDPRIGFLAAAKGLKEKQPALQQAVEAAQAAGNKPAIDAAQKALRESRTMHFNWHLNAVVTASFLIMVTLITLLSIREWAGLLLRKINAQLREDAPRWLPKYAVAEGRPLGWLSILGLFLALAKELSGESSVERIQAQAQIECAECGATREAAYKEELSRRFGSTINRCC